MNIFYKREVLIQARRNVLQYSAVLCMMLSSPHSLLNNNPGYKSEIWGKDGWLHRVESNVLSGTASLQYTESVQHMTPHTVHVHRCLHTPHL